MLTQIGFVSVLAAATIAAVAAGFRRDRFLGWAMLIAAAVYVAGGIAFGFYLEEVRGRAYFAPDELGYIKEGQRILQSWASGQPLQRAVEGGYPYWNAAVTALWGPSLVPLRLSNGVVGVLSIGVAYELGRGLFAAVAYARLAAVLVAAWPSLVVWSLGNLKERSIAFAVLLVATLSVRLLERWSVRLLIGLSLALVLLGQLRHYYGSVFGWACVAGFLLFARSPPRQRLARSVAVVGLVGAALWTFTGTFMATEMRHEHLRRYVTISDSEPVDHASSVLSVSLSESAGAPLEDLPQASAASPTSAPGAASSRAPAQRLVPAAHVGISQPEDSIPLRRDTDYSLQGESAGRAETASWRSAGEMAEALRYVLFGRFDSRGGAGRVLARVLYLEWLLSFLVVPLAVVGSFYAIARGVAGAWVVGAFVSAMIGVLTWAHGDDWTTFRLRLIYLPVMLVFASGGLVTMITALKLRWWSEVRSR